MVYLKNQKSVLTANNAQNTPFIFENSSNITLSSLANNSICSQNGSLENQFHSFLKNNFSNQHRNYSINSGSICLENESSKIPSNILPTNIGSFNTNNNKEKRSNSFNNYDVPSPLKKPSQKNEQWNIFNNNSISINNNINFESEDIDIQIPVDSNKMDNM